MVMKKEKLWRRWWFLWLMLVFVAPVGIALLWIQRKYHVVIRVLLSLFFGIVFLVVVLSPGDSDVQDYTDRSASVPTVAVAATSSAEEPEGEPEDKQGDM